MRKINRKSILFPNYISPSVIKIDISELKQAGITHVVFDIDETIVPKNHNSLTKPYIKFMKELEREEFILLIGSNSTRDLSDITNVINAQVVKPSHFSFKPFKNYYKKIIKAAGGDPKKIAMIGDKKLNDVVGANIAGLTTILVEPYARRQKLFDRIYMKLALMN